MSLDDQRRIRYAEALVPIAAELVGTVRDYGTDEVRAVLARVPHGNLDDLAVVLAAMVDPDARPAELLAWTEMGPVPSREWEPTALRTDRRICPDCGRAFATKALARHRRTHEQAVA